MTLLAVEKPHTIKIPSALTLEDRRWLARHLRALGYTPDRHMYGGWTSLSFEYVYGIAKLTAEEARERRERRDLEVGSWTRLPGAELDWPTSTL